MILSSFFAALGQIADPRFRRVLWLGIALTVALLVAATSGFVWLIGTLMAETVDMPWVGEITWLDDIVTWGSFFLFLGLSVFLMIPVASAITSMFLDQVAQAVEDRHYPGLSAPRSVPFGDAVVDTLNFLGVLIAANLLALILYVMFPPAAIFIFWGLNGFFLGREYFTLAAMRRIPRAEAKQLRRAHTRTIWLAGTLMAVPLSIPLINLLIPILGAATFTHIFHRVTGAAGRDQTSSYH